MQSTAGRQSAQRSSYDEDQIVLGVLDAIERNSAVTQRNVSRALGIALGLANAYLQRCVRKGWVKVSEVPTRRYAYFLTAQGFAEKSRLTASYLAHSFAFFRRARSQCSGIFETALQRGQRRLALVGAGDLAEIAALVARDHAGVQVLGILESGSPDAMREGAEKLGKVDAVIVTALDDPSAAYRSAREIFGDDRVYAPELLRVHGRRASRERA